MLEVGPIEPGRGHRDPKRELSLTALEKRDDTETALAENATLRRRLTELEARCRSAERRAELLESSRRTLLAVAWGGRR